MKTSKNVKIQVYCPKSSAEKVRMAIGRAGGGQIGNYSHCSFISEGYGYFLPLAKANPTIGKRGIIAKVREVKIEFICQRKIADKVIAAMKRAHPYEEVAYNIIPLLEQ